MVAAKQRCCCATRYTAPMLVLVLLAFHSAEAGHMFEVQRHTQLRYCSCTRNHCWPATQMPAAATKATSVPASGHGHMRRVYWPACTPPLNYTTCDRRVHSNSGRSFKKCFVSKIVIEVYWISVTRNIRKIFDIRLGNSFRVGCFHAFF